jgi:branched-chain amino acid transport system permease protein
MEFWVLQLFNGISYGALLFLLAGGLSLIFGLMRIVNMTHGSYYLLGGYVGLTVIWQSGHFGLAILAGAVTIALLGVCEWRVFLRRVVGQELGQVLTTMGIALILQDLALVLWGRALPVRLRQCSPYQLRRLLLSVYRLFIIYVALFVGVYSGGGGADMLWRDDRATVDDAEIAREWINVPVISVGVLLWGLSGRRCWGSRGFRCIRG